MLPILHRQHLSPLCSSFLQIRKATDVTQEIIKKKKKSKDTERHISRLMYSPLYWRRACLLDGVCYEPRSTAGSLSSPSSSHCELECGACVCERERVLSLAIVKGEGAKPSMLQHEQPLRLAWKPGSGCRARAVRCFLFQTQARSKSASRCCWSDSCSVSRWPGSLTEVRTVSWIKVIHHSPEFSVKHLTFNLDPDQLFTRHNKSVLCLPIPSPQHWHIMTWF